MQLQWYKRVYDYRLTKHLIDYAIDSLCKETKTNISHKRAGEMPMPADVQLTFKDGSKGTALYL